MIKARGIFSREATKDVWKQFRPKAWGEGVYEKVQAVK